MQEPTSGSSRKFANLPLSYYKHAISQEIFLPACFLGFECGELGTCGLWTPPNPQRKTTEWQKITTPKTRKLTNRLFARSRIIYCFVVKTSQLKDSNSIVILVCEKLNNCIQNFSIEVFKFDCESEHDEKNALACSNTCWNAMSQVEKTQFSFLLVCSYSR